MRQPHSNKTPIAEEMLTKTDPATGTLIFQFFNGRYAEGGKLLEKLIYSLILSNFIKTQCNGAID